jgi:hypothetical protein
MLLCLFLGLEGLVCLATASGCMCVVWRLVASIGQRRKAAQATIMTHWFLASVLLSCALVNIVGGIIVPLYQCMVWSHFP